MSCFVCIQTKPAVMVCVAKSASSHQEVHTVTVTQATYSWTTTPRVEVGTNTFMVLVHFFHYVEGRIRSKDQLRFLISEEVTLTLSVCVGLCISIYAFWCLHI